MLNFKNWLEDYLQNTNNFDDIRIQVNKGYFNLCTEPKTKPLFYWDTHTHGLELVGIDNMDKNADILDIGTWFGLTPYFLKKYGFTNVDSTECKAHSHDQRDVFERVCWPWANINPFELHILPLQTFELSKQYDLIMLFRTNVFWKTQEVCHTKMGSKMDNNTWQIIDEEGIEHFFYSVYKKHEWEFFIKNIRRFLKPGGKAIINPSPFVYDMIDGYVAEKDYLAPYTHVGVEYDKAGMIAYYIIIEN